MAQPYIPLTRTGLDQMLQRIADYNPDDGVDKLQKFINETVAAFQALHHDIDFSLARQLHDIGARVTLIGGFALASDEFANVAGPGADGTLVVFPRDPRTRPAAAGLLHRLQARNPDGTVFAAYAAVQVVAQAAARANSLDPKALAGVKFQEGREKLIQVSNA